MLPKNFPTRALLLLLFCACNFAQAATTQAVKSGNYSDNSIWDNGAPDFNISSGLDVIIPVGITITVNKNVTATAPNINIIVNGVLHFDSSASLLISSATITGTGSIDVDSFVYVPINYTDTLQFSGSLTCGTFWMKGKAIVSKGTTINADSVRIDHSLEIYSGTLIISDSGRIHVHRDTGTAFPPLLKSGGIIKLPSRYRLKYSGDSVHVGDEIGIWYLNQIELEIDPGSGKKVFWVDSSTLSFYNTLILTSGILEVTNARLSFYDNTSIMGNGKIDVNGSSIEIYSDVHNFGTLNLINGDKMEYLEVNFSVFPSYVTLGDDISIRQLVLDGGNLITDGHHLTIRHSSRPSIIHVGALGNYINLSGGGRLTKYLSIRTNTPGYYHEVVCPIGTDEGNFPLDIVNNMMLNAPIAITISCESEVRDAAGIIHNTQPVVKHTWTIETTATPADSLDINIQAYWDTTNEVNSFNRNSCYLSNFDSDKWVHIQPYYTAKVYGSGPFSANYYSVVRNHITEGGKFAVLDSRYLDVEQVFTNDNKINIYPNPATELLHFHNVQDGTKVQVYNMMGILVLQTDVRDNMINIAELPAGSYILKLAIEGVYSQSTFIKQVSQR